MNDLSWFLYAADVLPGISSFMTFTFGFVFILGGIGLVIWKVIYSLCEAEDDSLVDTPKSLWWLWGVASVIAFIFALVPSKETIYLIAGSEAGGYVVTSEAGQQIINDIHAVIKHQIDALKGGTE